MKILIVSATVAEILPFIQSHSLSEELFQTFHTQGHSVSILITGVGMTMTAFAMGKWLAKEKFDIALNIGVAGSFNKEMKIGSVVNVTQDRFGDSGVEDDEVFMDVFDLKLADANTFPFRDGWIHNDSVLQLSILYSLSKARAITVNKAHGNEKSIAKIRTHYSPDIESMEGAAFCYACAVSQVPYLQIRAVSNKIEKRNPQNWNIPLAVKKLNEWVLLFLAELK